jgi:hypothetical protein
MAKHERSSNGRYITIVVEMHALRSVGQVKYWLYFQPFFIDSTDLLEPWKRELSGELAMLSFF